MSREASTDRSSWVKQAVVRQAMAHIRKKTEGLKTSLLMELVGIHSQIILQAACCYLQKQVNYFFQINSKICEHKMAREKKSPGIKDEHTKQVAVFKISVTGSSLVV